MTGFCWKCHARCDDPIQFKSVCDRCGAYMHACSGCQFYQTGKPNDCQMPGTEPVKDREYFNYCEEFKSLSEAKIQLRPSVDDIAKRLFKD